MGFTNPGLSELGQTKVRALSSTINHLEFDHTYCSDLKRAVQTAELLGCDAPNQDSRLRELNFGLWEGKTWDQAYETDIGLFNQWSHDWVNQSPPDGESFLDLATRVNQWLAELPDNSVILVAAHAGSIRAIICQALGIPLCCAMQFSINHAGVSKLILSSKGNQCGFLNSNNFQ